MDRPEFHRLAEYELNEAAQYYDLEDPGLGAAFLDEVDRCLQSIRLPRSGSNPPWNGSAPASPPISIRGLVQDHAEWHQGARRDESQAPAYVLGRPRVMTRRRPNITFDRTAGSHTLATAGQRAEQDSETSVERSLAPASPPISIRRLVTARWSGLRLARSPRSSSVRREAAGWRPHAGSGRAAGPGGACRD